MEKEGRMYTQEFKKQIVELYKSGKSARTLAGEYGLVEQTIYKWVQKYDPKIQTEEGDNLSQADIAAMRKRIAELEMENEILKKATAIFARTK